METRELLLSIIVPVYKVENYLAQCIDSLLKQTYKYIEIILVDDGSPDKCGEICDEYAKRDSRIRVFHNENRGLCCTQNYGLQQASGDYIAFVDSDDYIENENSFLSLMREAQTSKADIIIGNYHKDVDGILVPTNPHGFHNQTDTATVDFRFKGFYSVGHLAYTWGKLYKRSFLAENKLLLKQYIYSCDKLFNVECYLKQPKYSFIEDSVYVYRRNFSSVSHQYKKNFAEIWMGISEEMYRCLQKMKEGNRYIDLVAFNIFFAIFFSSKQEYQVGNSIKAIRAELKKYETSFLTRKLFCDMTKGKYISSVSSILWKIMLWGFSLGYTLRLYSLLSLGIKRLVDWDIDAMLSSTGKLEKARD